MKNRYYILIAAALLTAAGCDKFLDKMPDNRTEIDSQEKIQALLVSAYPPTDYMLVTEFMSDNVDDYGANNPYTDRFIDQVFAWDDVTESDNEDPESVWEASYHAIACANEALHAIDSLSRLDASLDLSAERSEALLCRAYNHFILVNVFCIAYNPETSASDLGVQPSAMLRDWEYQSTMTQKYTAIVEHYIDASLNCNLLLMTAYSKMGLAFGPYYVYSRYAHGNYLAATETGEAIPNLWNGSNQTYWMGMKEYEATNLDKTMFWKLPYLFEYTDPVARIGYYRTVYPAFTADQVLLERAEANTLLGNYDEALDDVNLWIRNIASADETHLPRTLDLDRVNSWFDSYPYHVWDTSSVKKHLNPKFIHVEEGSTKENMLHCVLALKRVETLGQGLRWFDITRYGIQIDRRIINAEGRPYRNTGTLEPFDKRTAVQIPRKVRDAGITPNPRDNQ